MSILIAWLMSVADIFYDPSRNSLAAYYEHREREDELGNERLRILLEHKRETQRLNQTRWQSTTTTPKEGGSQ